MSERVDRYRECAAECERMARGVSDPAIVKLYLDLASSGTKWLNRLRS